jgi:hypothetical protein
MKTCGNCEWYRGCGVGVLGVCHAPVPVWVQVDETTVNVVRPADPAQACGCWTREKAGTA